MESNVVCIWPDHVVLGGGAHNWHPMSRNPNTGLVYFPAGSSSFATPVTYEPDGRQYIVVEVNGAGAGFGRGGFGRGGFGRGGDGPQIPARMVAFVLDGEPLPDPPPPEENEDTDDDNQ